VPRDAELIAVNGVIAVVASEEFDGGSASEAPADLRFFLEDDLILNGDPESKNQPVGLIHA
jgi:hypothetical protein